VQFPKRRGGDWDDWLPPPSLAADISAQAIDPDPDRWQPFLGQYQTMDLGALDLTGPTSRLYEDGGRLYLDGSDTDDETYLLHEIEPGLFFTETAEVVDLRTEPPTFRNLELTRVGSGPTPVAMALLVLCSLVIAAAVIPTPLRRLGTAYPNSPNESGEPARGRALRLAVTGATIATGVAGLASIALVAALPRITYSGYIGWADLPTLLEVWVRVPTLLFVSTVALAVLVAWYWRRSWRADRQHWTRSALIAAASVVTVMLASWQMLGVA
jgi:hypothetical protein